MLLVKLQNDNMIQSYTDFTFDEEISIITKFQRGEHFKICYNIESSIESSNIKEIIMFVTKFPIPKKRHLQLVKKG